MNSEPLSESTPRRRNGRAFSTSCKAPSMVAWPRSQHGSGFRPGRMDVGHIQGMSEFSRARIARVGDQVHFGEPWRGHLPAIRLHWNVVLEQMAGLGAAIDAPLPLGLLGPQSAIDLPGTDGQKLPLRRCAQPKPLSHPRHPDRQQRLQPHRPRVTGRFPNGRQDGQCFLAIAQRTSPRPPNGLLSWGRTVQKPNRVFPVVAGVETEFVQDHMFYPVPRLAVTLIDGSQVLPFRLMAHRNPPQKPSELGYILNGAITPPRITF